MVQLHPGVRLRRGESGRRVRAVVVVVVVVVVVLVMLAVIRGAIVVVAGKCQWTMVV
jgi:hypothetical protein